MPKKKGKTKTKRKHLEEDHSEDWPEDYEYLDAYEYRNVYDQEGL